MSKFLKATGILLILSGIGLFLMTTSSAANVGSRPARNQNEALGRDIGVGIGWSSLSCVSLILFVSGVFTWWAGNNAGKSSPAQQPPDSPTSLQHMQEPEREEPPERVSTKQERHSPKPIIVHADSPSKWTIIVGWSLFLYIFYCAVHFYSWANCDTHASLLTLFPVRQIYLTPAVEGKWSISDSLVRSIVATIEAGADERSSMYIVKHGDCHLLSTLARDAENRIQTSHSTSSVSSSAAIQVAPTTNLKIRSGPGTHYDQIGRLLEGKQVEAIGRNEAGTWIKIENGWLSAQYVEASGDLMSLPLAR